MTVLLLGAIALAVVIIGTKQPEGNNNHLLCSLFLIGSWYYLEKALLFSLSMILLGGDVVFLVSWVSALVHLGSGTKRAEGSALTISVAHCTGTLAQSH